jgi:hypothetical protein
VASAVSYETYCFGGGVVSAGGVAGAAAGAAWPAASAGAAVPAAGGAEESEAAGAGGGFAASGAADSCFAQAVSISATTIALRASLVFIDRYPEGSKSCVDETRPSAVVPAPVPEPRGPNSIEVPVRLETGVMTFCRARATDESPGHGGLE